MEVNPLGNTGLQVTRMGLGLAALGRPGYINLGHHEDLEADYDFIAMEARAHAVLDAAWEAGVRYIDVARSYGKAEAFLGSWVAAREREDLFISSKWGYTYTAGWRVQAEAHEVKEHSLAVLNRQINESRAILGEHLQLYQIHSATVESGVLENTAVLNRLVALKATGLRIGVSVSGARQAEVIRKASDLTIDGCRLFDTCQATWNLLEPSAGEALQEANDAGLGIVIKEGVANGRLTARNRSAKFAESRQYLDTLAQRHGVSLDAIALAGVLAQPWVNTVLSGAAQVDHLLANVEACAVALTCEDLATLSALAESPEDYWGTRSSLAWN